MNNKLIHTGGRILVRVDKEQKNNFTFSNGTTIRLERDYNNLDNSYVKQTFGEVISGKDIPVGAMILFHFNCVHPSNEIFNHGTLSGEEVASGMGIYSFNENECFLWRLPDETEWHPIGNFSLALKVFKPYNGVLENIPPTEIKNVLYFTTGNYKGLVGHVVNGAAYRIIFRNQNGQDETILRCRADGDEATEREPELMAISHELTDGVNDGSLLVGLTISDAKSIPNTTKPKNNEPRPIKKNDRRVVR